MERFFSHLLFFFFLQPLYLHIFPIYQIVYCLVALKNNNLYVCEVSLCQPGWTVRQAAAVRVSQWVPQRSSGVNGGDKRYSH